MMTRDDFNQFCNSLRATSHVVQWQGSDVWKVGDKMFAICSSQDNPLPGITFKTSALDYEVSGHAKLIIYSFPNPLSTFSIYAASLSRLS